MRKYNSRVQCGLLKIASVIALCGCTSQTQVPATAPASPALNASPNLTSYNRYELVAAAIGSRPEQQTGGRLVFQHASGLFDVQSEIGEHLGRLFVQPETCRDDVSMDCQRRFVVAGRIEGFGVTVNCYVPVRNDTDLGYRTQALVGICRDSVGRSFALSVYAQR